MTDKDLKFTVISTLVSFISLGLIIGTVFVENTKTKFAVTVVAFSILILQKLIEFIIIKKTRKISAVIFLVLVGCLIYYLTKFSL